MPEDTPIIRKEFPADLVKAAAHVETRSITFIDLNPKRLRSHSICPAARLEVASDEPRRRNQEDLRS